jgi:hypothetical protein
MAFNLRTAVNAGDFAQSFGRLRLALSAPRTARCALGKRKPHPPQNLAQTHPAELPFLGLKRGQRGNLPSSSSFSIGE